MDEAGFFMGFPVGHHGARIRLRPGARRRGNGYERKGLADDRKPPARSGWNVIPVIAAVGRHQGNGLGGVHAASPAQRDDEIAAVVPGELSPGVDGRFQRVGLHPVKHGVLDARQVQQTGEAVQISVGPRGLSVGNDDHGLVAGQWLIVQMVQLPGSEKNPGRHMHVETRTI